MSLYLSTRSLFRTVSSTQVIWKNSSITRSKTIEKCLPSLSLNITCYGSSQSFWIRHTSHAASFGNQSDGGSYSVILPGKERIRISPLIKDNPETLVTHTASGCGTAYDCLLRGHELSNNGDCLGTRSQTTGKYEWISYSELIEKAQHLGSALIELGCKPQNDTLIGINCGNRKEFVFTSMACSAYSMALCPLYDTYGKEALFYVLNLTNLPLVIVDKAPKVEVLLNNKDKLPSLKTIILMDPVSPDLQKLSKEKNVGLLQFDEVLEIGRKSPKPVNPSKPDDLLGIFFTSGTTGTPKGVMITHSQAIATIISIKMAQHPACSSPKSTTISYLPVSHMYEILCMVSHLYEGARIGFFCGKIPSLLDDAKELKPTYFPLVPRLMNKVYQKVMAEIEPKPIANFLLKMAMRSKEKQRKKGIIKKNTIWDKLILHNIQDILGGKVELIMCSSAPISKEVMRFFKLTMSCYVFEAYGQTEIGAATCTSAYFPHEESVGGPIPSCHLKLVDVPELNYFSQNDEGEICIKGTTVFNGYFRNPEATKESTDPEGWHHTGDIGRWLPDGTLKIIDRKKHILKTSQGEYLAPEKIECVYIQSPVLLQVFVDGVSDKDYLVGIVVPDTQVFLPWLRTNGVNVDNFEEASKKKEVADVLLRHLHSLGQQHGLNSLEQIKAVHLLSKPFSIEDGTLTPTQKVRREVVRKKYADVIRNLYQ